MAGQSCEAKITSKITDYGESRKDYDFEGRVVRDRGPQFADRLSKATATVDCSKCVLSSVLNTEGGPPYGAINEASRQVTEFIRNNCQKLRENGYRPDQMSQNWVPR